MRVAFLKYYLLMVVTQFGDEGHIRHEENL